MITTVDAYLTSGCGRCDLFDTPQCKVHPFRDVLETLRAIVLDCGLTETVKWGQPCYTCPYYPVLTQRQGCLILRQLATLFGVGGGEVAEGGNELPRR